MRRTHNKPAPSKNGPFYKLATLAGMSDSELITVDPKALQWPEGMYLLQEVLQYAGKSNSQLFCLDEVLIHQFDGYISIDMKPLFNGRSAERIKGKNEIVDPSSSLTAESLRRIFVLVEATVFKCVHIKLENHSSSYRTRSETYEERLVRLEQTNLISLETKRLGQELYRTRCQFAHSARPVDHIEYLSKPLQERWGSTGAKQTRKLKRLFLPDAYQYAEALLKVFKPVQGAQICHERFRHAIGEISSQTTNHFE